MLRTVLCLPVIPSPLNAERKSTGAMGENAVRHAEELVSQQKSLNNKKIRATSGCILSICPNTCGVQAHDFAI